MSTQAIEKKQDGQQEIAPPQTRDVWSELDNLRQTMNRWLSGFPFHPPHPKFSLEGNFASMFSSQPALNMLEEGKNLVVEAEIPGFEKNDVEVTVHDDVLTIKAEKKQQSEEKKEGYYMRERQEGRLVRNVRLPREVDSGKVQAHYKDGVLRIEMPMTESSRRQAVKVDIK